MLGQYTRWRSPRLDNATEAKEAALKLFQDVTKLTVPIGFQDACDIAAMAYAHVSCMPEPIEVSVLATEIRYVKDGLIKEAFYRRFLHIEKDRIDFLEKDNLFGIEVADKFSSAIRDIKEAGNCLAAECGTATVFHLMRAAEFAMRALARDREVSFSDKPLEEKEWGHDLLSVI
jgi:hypothetical protein